MECTQTVLHTYIICINIGNIKEIFQYNNLLTVIKEN